jgi:hypothetical protein
MGRKEKSYRGQRKHYSPCGCFLCTGTDKEDRRLIEEKRLDCETKEIINNVCLYNVSSSFSCDAVTECDEERNETYCKECGKCI